MNTENSLPFSPFRLLLLMAALIFFIIFVQLGAISIAFEKLGLSDHSAYLLLFATLLGSMVNLPLMSIESNSTGRPPQGFFRGGRNMFAPEVVDGKTHILVNVGGALIPFAFSFYLLMHHPISLLDVCLSVGLVSVLAHVLSRPVPGVGIGMPVFIVPVAAALIASFLDPGQRAPLAYISGSLGVLVGADLTRLKDIRNLGAPLASIGGAGTFDGIFLAGFLAVLLA